MPGRGTRSRRRRQEGIDDANRFLLWLFFFFFFPFLKMKVLFNTF